MLTLHLKKQTSRYRVFKSKTSAMPVFSTIDQHLKATGPEKEPGSPLFPAAIGKTGKLSRRPLVRTDAADMLKRRLKQAGLPAHYSPHSFRATGITNFLENDGILQAAQRIPGHADSRTMKLYDRRGKQRLGPTVEELETSLRSLRKREVASMHRKYG
jgi:integrase